jgi:hypothetical protein
MVRKSGAMPLLPLCLHDVHRDNFNFLTVTFTCENFISECGGTTNYWKQSKKTEILGSVATGNTHKHQNQPDSNIYNHISKIQKQMNSDDQFAT